MDKEKIIQLLMKNKPVFHPLKKEMFSEKNVKADLSISFCENLKLVV